MGWIMIFICIGLVYAAQIVIFKMHLMVLGVILLVVSAYLLYGLRYVHEEERKVVELFGRYFMIIGPGLTWLLPIAMKIRTTVYVWELQISLFSDEPAKLDLKDGSVTPEGAKGFVKMKSPKKPYKIKQGDKDEEAKSGAYRVVYETPDWKEWIEDRLENALRSHLNAFTIDEVLTAAKAGFNLADHRVEVGLPNDQLEAIEDDLHRWGFDLLRITITDFELPPNMVAARDAVQIAQRGAEAAKFQAEREAEETGGAVKQMFCKMTGMSRDEVEKALREDPERFVKKYQSFWEKAWDTIYRRMGIDGSAYLDVRTQNPLADLIALFKKISDGGSEKGKNSEETKGKKTKKETAEKGKTPGLESVLEEVEKEDEARKGKRE